MKRIISVELSLAFRNSRFLLAVIFAVILFIVGAYRDPFAFGQRPTLHPVGWYLLNINFSEFKLFAPLFAALPFADSFLSDWSQGFQRFIVQRTRYRSYLTAKILAVAVSGGLALVLIELVIFAGGFTRPFDWAGSAWHSLSPNTVSAPNGPFGAILNSSPIAYFLFQLGSAGCFGACMALVGLAISTIIHNRYVALAFPLVLSQLLAFLVQRTVHIPQFFDLLLGLFPQDAIPAIGEYTFSHQLLQYLVIGGLATLTFWIGTKRMRRNL